MAFDDLDLDLVRSGLVLVTGNNGEGKSSIIEMISTAFWGDTVRGSSPWRANSKGHVSAWAIGKEGLFATRTKTAKGSPVLAFETEHNNSTYPSSAKAQEALSELIPSHEVWKRCAVFTKADAAKFSAGRDSDRKALLEAILGLSKFDDALSACKVDLRKAEAELNLAISQIERCTSALEREREALTLAETSLQEAEESAPEVDSSELDSVEKSRAKAEKSLREARAERDEVVHRLAESRAELSASERELERFKNGNCPTCERPLEATFVAKIKKRVDAAKLKAEEGAKESESTKKRIDGVVQKKAEEMERLLKQASTLKVKIQQSKASSGLKDRLLKASDDSRDQIQKLQKDLSQHERNRAKCEVEVEELKAAQLVLGLRGVRSAVLAEALSGLEVVANGVLSTISPEVSLELKPYSEQKSGNTVETISMQINGAGGGLGYQAASDGQRRRVDIAMLIGLSALAEGASGVRGDLFLDEVFDGLDEEGVTALGDYLVELADDRKVVVITHNPYLVEALKPKAAQRIHVEAHEVTTRTA